MVILLGSDYHVELCHVLVKSIVLVARNLDLSAGISGLRRFYGLVFILDACVDVEL